MRIKRTIAAFIAAMLALISLPVAFSAAALSTTETEYPTPEGYDDHDYQAAVAFLTAENEAGVKNYETLDALSSTLTYDPADPTTWGKIILEEPSYVLFNGIIWTEEPVKRLRGLWIEIEGDFPHGTFPLYGSIDFSNCSALTNFVLTNADHLDSINLTGCSALRSYCTSRTGITSADFSGCTSLMAIDCTYEDVTYINIPDSPLLEQIQCCGTLITNIDVSNCPDLTFLNAADCKLSSLDVSNCHELEMLWCEYNDLTSLSVEGLTKLNNLHCNDNRIASLNINGCTELMDIYCQNNCLTELDFTSVTYPYFKTVRAEGSGFVGYRCGLYVGLDRAIAEPKAGAEFLGWYAEDGSLISNETELLKNATDQTVITARFTEVAAVPGDIDNDGSVTANDALMVMRYSLGLISSLPMTAAADVDGNGSVTANDALLIMRAALGLVSL